MKLLFDQNLSFKLCQALADLYGPPPKAIWLRCGNQPTPLVENPLHFPTVPDEEEAAQDEQT